MENLDGTCSYIRGTANPLTGKSRSGNILKGCSTSDANPSLTSGEQRQQDTAQGMWEKAEINCICLLNLRIPFAKEELSLARAAYLTDD